MSALHTAGPWPTQVTEDGKAIRIGVGLVDGPNGYDVAEVDRDDTPRDEVEANARLIAAAPDLLAALEDILKVRVEGWENIWAGSNRCQDIARAAIARATLLAEREDGK